MLKDVSRDLAADSPIFELYAVLKWSNRPVCHHRVMIMNVEDGMSNELFVQWVCTLIHTNPAPHFACPVYNTIARTIQADINTDTRSMHKVEGT